MSSLVTDKIVKNTKQKKTHIWSSKHDLSIEPSEYPLKTQGHMNLFTLLLQLIQRTILQLKVCRLPAS